MMLHLIRANKTKHGGAEVYLSRLADELKAKNISYKTIHSNIPKILPSWLRVTLFNIQTCLFKKQNDIYLSLERISCADIYRAGDGVHKVFCKVEKKSFLNPLHFVYIYLEKRCFQNSKKIIANSNMIKEQIIQTYDINPSKIDVIYNGINLKPKVNFDSLKDEFNIKDEKIILYVGSGFKRKGVEEFLNIISKLKYHNFKAFIVGKEKKISSYKNLALELNISHKVIFTGARDDVDKFYSMSDIFLFPTRYEPFSNVVLEAMMYENAVITTKQNGASEILNDNYTMQKSKDYHIITKIDDLLNNQDKLDKIKARNLEIIQNFTIEKNTKQTLKVIDENFY